eukprot:682425-Prorocentrum_lima.AAC.1
MFSLEAVKHLILLLDTPVSVMLEVKVMSNTDRMDPVTRGSLLEVTGESSRNWQMVHVAPRS